MKKSIKNRNKTKSRKRTKINTKRKYKFRGSGTGSSKALSPIDELNRIDREKQRMNVKQKLEAINKLAPEELVITIDKEPKDMSISELKNNLAFLGVYDTKRFIEKTEFQNLLSSKYTEMNNDTVDHVLDSVITKRRATLVRELRENEEKQRMLNLEKQRMQEEKTRRKEEEKRRMQEEQIRKEQEKQRKKAQSKMNEIIDMDIDSDVQSHIAYEESLRHSRYPRYPQNQATYSRNYGYPPPPLPPFRPATYQIDYENGIIHKTTWNGIKTQIHTEYTKY